MGFFDRKPGKWKVYSKIDPRWDNGGDADGLVCEGGPPEMATWIRECIEKYGEAPKDLTQEFRKY